MTFSGHVEKQRDSKDRVKFKIYDITIWKTNNCDINIASYLKK